MDLTATAVRYEEGGLTVYETDLIVEIPAGYMGLIFPRSSVSKTDLLLANCVGVIDSGYRNQILIKFRDLMQYVEPENRVSFNPLDIYKVGDRVAQLIILPYPEVEFEEVEELSKTERGVGGFGSTNKLEHQESINNSL